MPRRLTVLLVGGTGRTGRHVLQQLLDRGISVRAIVRPGRTFSPGTAQHPQLTVVEANLLALTDEELQRHVDGCEAVVSCLGHILTLRGVFGPPHDLVTRATQRLCGAIETLQPALPVKFILMSSVSVDRTGGVDTRRSAMDRALLRVICTVLPPARDNQRAADFLQSSIGSRHSFVQWCVVRPDTLLPGGVSEYSLHEGIVASLFEADSTNMANIAHFMCELVTNTTVWADWKSRLPVIINTPDANVPVMQPA